MRKSRRSGCKLIIALAAMAAVPAVAQQAQGGRGSAQQSGPAVTSVMANPYRIVPNWPNLGAIKPGAAIGILPDGKGGLWLQHRSDPAIVHINAAGTVDKRFDVTFSSSHGLCLDRDGNFWALDASTFNEGPDTGVRGNQVFKYSPEGKLLLTLGKAGVSKRGPDTFISPSGCVSDPDGNMIIADGHWVRPKSWPQDGDRLMWFTRDGKFIKEFGSLGHGPGEFMGPHGLAFDSQGRLFVVDRSNNRIQIFDRNMNYLDDWKHFGRPSNIWILKDDTMLVADSESSYPGFRPVEFGLAGIGKEGQNIPRNGGWKNGVRIGSAKDGSLRAFIPGTRPEGLAAEADGSVIYAGLTNGCDVSPSGGCLQKWVKK
jgi:DNA-binding beta-propeller fold protein YncE